MAEIERDPNRRVKEGFRYSKNVAGPVVYDEELGEIVNRRAVAFLDQVHARTKPSQQGAARSANGSATPTSAEQCPISNAESGSPTCCEDVRRTLFGLALSGGGIRSGAVNLGVLKRLCQRGLLPFVDYLSTVSGGGYAGAYLSSATLQHRSGKCSATTSTGAADSNGRAGSDSVNQQSKPFERGNELLSLLPAFEGTAGESTRMQKFIYRGNYLMSVTRFVNRHLVGMLLVWTVVSSGLIAAGSLVTWLFRLLDEPSTSEKLLAVGCESDVARALFPSFVLFVLWLMAWGLSYILYRSRALGSTARVLFGGLIFSLLVGIACLLGTGDISLSSVAPPDAVSGRPVTVPSDTANKIAGTLSTMVIGGILAGLLPYLSPGRLLRSGTRPKNAVEKATFAIATRMLLFGVPFLIVSWFAREDVSQIMARRPPLLARGFIKNWETSTAPLWIRMQTESEPAKDDKKGDPGATQESKKSPPPRPGLALWKSIVLEVGPKPFESIRTNLQKLEEHQGLRFRVADGSNETIHSQEIDKVSHVDYSRDRAPSSAARYFRVGWDLVELTGTAIFNKDDLKENQLSKIAAAQREVRQARDLIIKAINQELLRPDFYSHFESSVTWLESNSKDERELEGRDLKKLRALLNRAKNFPIQRRKAEPVLSLTSEEAVRQLVSINRQILDAWYPDTIKPSTEVFAHVVLTADQDTRLTWFWWSLGVFLVAGMVVDLNTTSWHGYYARSLAENWIEPVPGLKHDIPLSQIETTSVGAPYHLISASMQMLGRQHEPGKSSHDHFLLSKRYCGSPSIGYVSSDEYMEGEVTLPDAIAMSGGAISPGNLANPLLRSLMFLGNLRLGKWMENPNGRRIGSDLLQHLGARWPVAPLRILSRMWMPAEERPFCFVTDGGMDENLGVGALLRRRCRLIMSVDVAQDTDYEFADLAKLFRWARVRQGITFEALAGADVISKQIEELAPLKPKRESNLTRMQPDQFSTRHFLVMRIRYPQDPMHAQDAIHPDSPETGLLVYVKASLTGDEPLELQRFAAADGEFPHNPTSDQFYNPDRFESYRQLGEHLTDIVCRDLPDLLAAEISPAVEPHIQAAIQKMRDLIQPGSQPPVTASASPSTATAPASAVQPVTPDLDAATDGGTLAETNTPRGVDPTESMSFGDGNNEHFPPADASSYASTPRGAESSAPAEAADKVAPQSTASSRPESEPTWDRQWTATLRDHHAESSARNEAVLSLEPYLAQSDEILRSFLDALDCDDELLENLVFHSLYDGCSAQSIALLRDYGLAKRSPPKTKRRVVNLLGELCWRGKIELDDATFDQLVKFTGKIRDHQLAEAAIGALELHLLSLARIQSHPQRQALIRDILQQRRKARRPSRPERSRGRAK